MNAAQILHLNYECTHTQSAVTLENGFREGTIEEKKLNQMTEI